MHPILFDFFGIPLYTYGLFVALGFMTAVFVSRKLAAPRGIKEQTITDIYFIILLSAIVGARGLYILVNFDSYKNNLFDIFKIWSGGLVFFGGFILAVVATLVYLNYRKLNVWLTADVIVPGIALGHSLGRVGCLFAGCCYGKTCDLPIAINFTHPQSLAPLHTALYPTQIYMVLSNLTLFFILLGVTKNKKFHGQVFIVYIMLYSLFRFIIEFFRGDFRGDFFLASISLSQGIGITVSVVACILLIKLSKSANGNR